MDAATGNFVGQVRDYFQANNKLMRKIGFANGLRHGRYEEYYNNQQISVRGQYVQGSPSGIWHAWYKNGQPHQSLLWTGRALPSLQVLNYWDEEGQQQVTNGEGLWRGKREGNYPTWFGGPIVKGFQQGEWESHDARTNEVLTIEEFNQGRLKQGRQLVAQGLGLVGQRQESQEMTYTTRPSLEIELTDASRQAEPLHLGQTCRQRARAEKTVLALMEITRESNGRFSCQMPKPRQEPRAYLQKLLAQLSTDPALMQGLPQEKANKSVVFVDIDEGGKIVNVMADSWLAAALVPVLASLGDWTPATVNGKPMAGQVQIILGRPKGRLEGSLKTNLAVPLLPGEEFISK